MEKNEVEEYLNTILNPKLKQLGVSKEYIKEMIEHIKNQIYSLLKHWNDVKFRETILLLGLEEGNFYKPREASLKVKCFVVVTIRNSLLETIASVDYKKAGLKKYIEDEDVKNITMDAIRYFNALNLRKIAEKLDYSNCDDIYFKVANQYKMAWKALNELYCCGGRKENTKKLQTISL